MANVRTDFSAGQVFGRKVGRAISRGLTATMIEAQGIASQGIFSAGNSVTRKVSKSGIEYFTGRGAPIGGYPGPRTGTLERSLYVENGRFIGTKMVGFFGASAPYSIYVHGRDGSEKRPFLLLPFRNNRARLRDVFVKTTRRELA